MIVFLVVCFTFNETRPGSVFVVTNLRLFFMISVFTGGLGAAGFGAG